jgi:hypothetical protein
VWVEFVRRAEAERPQLDIWLKEAVKQQLPIGDNLPRLMQLYLVSCLIKSEGGRPANFSERDSAIYRTVTAATERGFRLERNIESLNAMESASSIVAAALSELGDVGKECRQGLARHRQEGKSLLHFVLANLE